MTKTCPQCKGNGKVICTVIEGKKESELPIKCPTCNGTKVVDKNYQTPDIWCRCQGEVESYYVPDSARAKHHWRCNNCHKVTQIG